MSSEVTYQAFRCKGCIFVMYHTEDITPQQLTAFRQPAHMFIHNGRLVGLYPGSDMPIPLTEPPEHDVRQILSAIENAIEDDTRQPAISGREGFIILSLSTLTVLLLTVLKILMEKYLYL